MRGRVLCYPPVVQALAAGAPAQAAVPERTLRLVTPGSASHDARLDAATSDGRHVYFTTNEPILGTGDVDTAFDVYERAAGGGVRLVSSGTAIRVRAVDRAGNDASRSKRTRLKRG
jgi:hypothetical protein